MIGARSVHPRALSAAPNVARSDHDADLCPHVHTRFDNGADLFQKSIVENPLGARGKRLAGQLDEHPLI